MKKLLNGVKIDKQERNSIIKRKIIEKFTLTLEQKSHLRVADEEKGVLKTIAKRTFNIDKGFIKISFKDVILMQSILGQIGQERQYIEWLSRKTGRPREVIKHGKENESSSLENLDLKVESLGLYVINSRRDIFIPILKVTFGAIAISKANTFKKDILKGDASLAVYYFNHSIFRWEPILDRINLAFHKLTYYQ